MQNIIALTIVAAALIIAVFKTYKKLSGKESGCGCGCNGCPCKKDCNKENNQTQKI